MKNASWTLSLAVAAACMAPAAAQMQQGSMQSSQLSKAPRLVVNGRVIQTDVAPRIINGHTLVPIRFVAQALGANVTWQPDQQQAVIEYEGQRVVAQAGENTLVAGNRSVRTEVPTQVIQGRTMIPLRAVAETLGANVQWDPQTRTVYVRTAGVAGQQAQPSSADQIRQALNTSLDVGQQTYQAGAPVQMTLNVRNTGDQAIRLQMPTGQMYDFVVQNSNGQEIWHWSNGRAFTQSVTQVAVPAGETRSFTVTWNQQDDQGNQVPPGSYTIVGMVTDSSGVPLRSTQTIQITGGS